MKTARELVMGMAWHDAVTWAWSRPDAHAAFRGATGRPQESADSSPLGRMIDKAIGGQIDDAYLNEFVDWFTVHHWGEDDAPPEWKAKRLAALSDQGEG